MSNIRLPVDLPTLPHNAAKGEIVFSALLLRKCYAITQGHADVIEIPLYGYRDQPTFAVVDFTRNPRRPEVTRVIGKLARKAC